MKEIRKKNEFIQKFVEVMEGKRTNVAFHEAARKAIEELDALDGAFIDDITIDDFEDSEINGARAVKIAQYVKDGRGLSAGMIRDFLLVAGVAEVKKLDDGSRIEPGRRRNDDLCYFVNKLASHTMERLRKEAKERGCSMSVLVEKAILNYIEA